MSHTIFSLKQKLDYYQQVAILNREDSNKLSKLFDVEVMNEYGNPTKHQDELRFKNYKQVLADN